MVRRGKYLVTAFAAVVSITGAFSLGRASAPEPASAASAVSKIPITFSSYYLDIGASQSLGFQPTGVPHHNGLPTNTGYSNDLIRREALKGVALNLEQIGCPGDTVESLHERIKVVERRLYPATILQMLTTDRHHGGGGRGEAA